MSKHLFQTARGNYGPYQHREVHSASNTNSWERYQAVKVKAFVTGPLPMTIHPGVWTAHDPRTKSAKHGGADGEKEPTGSTGADSQEMGRQLMLIVMWQIVLVTTTPYAVVQQLRNELGWKPEFTNFEAGLKGTVKCLQTTKTGGNLWKEAAEASMLKHKRGH